MTLDLRAPFRYHEMVAQDPLSPLDEGESIACFELMDSDSIEVDRENYLGALRFLGKATNPALALEANEGEEHIVNAGMYLFVQHRPSLDRELFIDTAIELQKEGLWRRYQLDKYIYLRILSEEEGPVFQVLRPFTSKEE
ncbi:hypothetical protein MASR2M78_09880 [Treponema sp.]